MAHDLTQRQQRVVETIQAWIKEHGLPPTIRELGKQLGIKSLRGVTTHLDALVRKGRLVRRRGARGIRVLMDDAPAVIGRSPAAPGTPVGDLAVGGVPASVGLALRASALPSATSPPGVVPASVGAAQALRVPIVGRIAAGAPLLAQERLDGELLIDPSRLGAQAGAEAASHFALRVRGRSMQGAGILNGDYVIVRQQPTADNGAIVAALIGEEATVKRFFREGDRIRLQPENPAMEPLLLGADQPVEILGKVVAVFRQL